MALAGSGVVFVRCASSQTVENANPAEIWSSLVELAERSNAVKKEGLCQGHLNPQEETHWELLAKTSYRTDISK